MGYLLNINVVSVLIFQAEDAPPCNIQCVLGLNFCSYNVFLVIDIKTIIIVSLHSDENKLSLCHILPCTCHHWLVMNAGKHRGML